MSHQPLRDNKTPRIKNCLACGREMNWHTEFRSQPMASWKTRKYCSTKCSNSHRKRALKFPEVERIKICQHCGKKMNWHTDYRWSGIEAWTKRKFCSKKCSDEGGFRYTGEDHPNYKPDARSRNRKGSTGKWISAVHAKCDYTCQDCGADGNKEEVYLVAHHIKSWAEHPDLRFDVNNGTTLCVPCHELVHYGKLDYPIDEDEIIEKITPTSMSRRVKVQCSNCGANLYKAPSDLIHYPSREPKKHSFCNKHICMSEFFSRTRTREENPRYQKRVVVECSYCDKSVEKLPSKMINPITNQEWKRFFCDKECWSKYFKIEWTENNPNTYL